MMNTIETVTQIMAEDEEKGIVISITSFPEMPIITFIEYDDSVITFSKQLCDIILMYGIDYKNGKWDIEQVVNGMLDLAKKFRKIYDKAQEKNCPSRATMFCDKRDKTKQFYKMMANEHFSNESMYKFALDCYSSIEDSYGYDALVKAIGLYGIKCNAKERIKKELGQFIDKEGYIELYRGINTRNRIDGLSFTLNIKVAKFFAKRWGKGGYVNKYKVHIDDVLGFINNGEEEIITEKAIITDKKYLVI